MQNSPGQKLVGGQEGGESGLHLGAVSAFAHSELQFLLWASFPLPHPAPDSCF